MLLAENMDHLRIGAALHLLAADGASAESAPPRPFIVSAWNEEIHTRHRFEFLPQPVHTRDQETGAWA